MTSVTSSENLFWAPHSTEIWAVVQYSSAQGQYIMKCPVDAATIESPGDILDLSPTAIKKVISLRKDVSGIFRQFTGNNFTDLIQPILDIAGLEGPDNICNLTDVSEASVLHSLRQRYLRDAIYSNVGKIVIAMNPFTEIKGLYGPAVSSQFLQAENPYKLSPHVYQVAAAAYKRLAEKTLPQATIITGESGAGKTESTKLILEFLANAGTKTGTMGLEHTASNLSNARQRPTTVADRMQSRRTMRHSQQTKHEGSSSHTTSIENRILRVNPLLEAFGNATTSRNPNSSRFGKWIEIQFDNSLSVIGATITSYLLELPRVTRHVSGERGYHVFYQLLLALQGDLASLLANYELEPGDPLITQAYHYLLPDMSGGVVQPLPVNDTVGFAELKNSLMALQFDPSEQDGLFSIVAALLHIGNITFDLTQRKGGTEGAITSPLCQKHLSASARLLQLDEGIIQQCVEYREVKTGNESIQIPLQVVEAEAARDGFAKLIYGCLFDWILYRCNASLKGDNSEGKHLEDYSFVGLLDIAGFESFTINGFEQLCINLANEKLQYQFNWDIFQSELDDYSAEGLEGLSIEFSDNSDVLELIEGKGGILSILDEELFVPRGSDKGFVDKLLKSKSTHPRMIVSKIRGDNKFSVQHFAAPVSYTATNWLEKNQYAPPKLGAAALQQSTNPVVQAMISDVVTDKISEPNKKGSRMTVGISFKRQLESLMTKIKSTEVHYVRCIKPNQKLTPGQVDSIEILRQLSCSGAMEAIQIRKSGYPIRVPMTEFISRFALLYGRRAGTLMLQPDLSVACRILLDHIQQTFGVVSTEVKLGKTRVFLTDSIYETLTQYRNLALAEPATRIQAAYRGYRVRKCAKEALEVNRGLRPLLGVGAAALAQGGHFLYPASVVHGVTTGGDLAFYVDGTGRLLERCSLLLPEFQPGTLGKAKDIFDRMRKEADIVEEAERLHQEQSMNVAKLTGICDRAARYNMLHPIFQELKHRSDQIQFELTLLPDVENAINQSEGYDRANELLGSIQNYLDVYGLSECITKQLRRCLPVLIEMSQVANIPIIEDVPTDELHALESRLIEEPESVNYSFHKAESDPSETQLTSIQSRSKDKTSDYDLSSYSAPTYVKEDEEESSVESSDWDWSSTDDESEDDIQYSRQNGTRDTLPTSAGKFMKELRSAVALLDAERLDILIQGYQDAGLGSRNNREFVNAKTVRSNLDRPDWINAEIKESVVSVVWGTNDHNDVSRLTNLIKRAAALAIQSPEVESGQKALQCLRASPAGQQALATAAGVSAEKNRVNSMNIVSHGVFDIRHYPGLRINKKKKTGFFASVFGGKRANADMVCSHSFDRLREPLTVFTTKENDIIAIDLFRYIQSYMGDRPHIAKDYLADDIVHLGLNTPEIRDELYLQLLKQLTRNPNQTSESRGWSLLLFCCQNFVPSSELQPYVKYFLFQRTATIGDFTGGVFDENGEIAKHALLEFDKSVSRPIAWKKPVRPDLSTIQDLEINQTEWDADVIIKMLDDSRQKISISFDTTLADIISSICKRFNMDTSGWTIMILNEVDDAMLDFTLPILDLLGFDLLSQKVIQSTLFALWGFPQFRVLPDSQRIWDIWDPIIENFPQLVFRRRLISTSEMLYPHPYHAHLTYKQLIWEFRKYPLAESLPVLASVIARILVAEKWVPSTVAYEALRSSRSPPGPLGQGHDLNKSAIRAMAITYSLLETSGYIPAVYGTQHPRFQMEWEIQVQRVYQTLDSDEHQLLAINNVLTEMRRLKAFGALCWLVVEPNDSIFEVMITGSQLRAAYSGTTVDMSAGILRSQFKLLSEQSSALSIDDSYHDTASQMFAWDKTLQPMVITPNDLQRLQEELDIELELKADQANKHGFGNKKKSMGKLKNIFKRILRKKRHSTDHTRHYEGLFASSEFAAGENPNGEIHQPLWMAFNSYGLHFCPAVSFGVSNLIEIQPVSISSQQLFACETLWTYHQPTASWTYAGLLFCVDLRLQSNPIETSPHWAFVAVIPLTSSVPAIHSALRAFIPSLNSYGETPSNCDETHEDEVIQHQDPTNDDQTEHSEWGPVDTTPYKNDQETTLEPNYGTIPELYDYEEPQDYKLEDEQNDYIVDYDTVYNTQQNEDNDEDTNEHESNQLDTSEDYSQIDNSKNNNYFINDNGEIVYIGIPNQEIAY